MKWFKKKKNISFKEAIDLTGFPIITFESKDKKFKFVLDTRRQYSVFNNDCTKTVDGRDTVNKTR